MFHLCHPFRSVVAKLQCFLFLSYIFCIKICICVIIYAYICSDSVNYKVCRTIYDVFNR